MDEKEEAGNNSKRQRAEIGEDIMVQQLSANQIQFINEMQNC